MEDDHCLITRALLLKFTDDLSGQVIYLLCGIAVSRHSVDKRQILRREDAHVLRSKYIGIKMLDEFGHKVETEAGRWASVGIGRPFGHIVPFVASEEIDIMRLDSMIFSGIIVGAAAALHDLDLQFWMEMFDKGTVVLRRVGIIESDAGFALSFYGQDDLSVVHSDRSPFRVGFL